MWQNWIVASIVIACSAHAAWALAQKLRGVWNQSNSQANASSTAGSACSACAGCASGPRACSTNTPKVTAQALHFHPRKTPSST